MVQNYTKSDSWSQNLLEKFGQLQTSSGKSKKLKFDWLLLPKKYIPSAKTLHTRDLSYFHLPDHQTTYVIFETINYFSGHNLYFFSQRLDHFSGSSDVTRLYLFSWDFICYWQKEPRKVQIFILATARIKIHQIPYVIFWN